MSVIHCVHHVAIELGCKGGLVNVYWKGQKKACSFIAPALLSVSQFFFNFLPSIHFKFHPDNLVANIYIT